ncbi:MAG: hypothetical protein M5U19_08130 [Microthrixaceae bacterium]|nr:hypothetical protein [Microthrixaceae bacterium]
MVDQYLMSLADSTRIDVARLRERLTEIRRRPPETTPGERAGVPREDPRDAPGGSIGLPPIPQGAEREAIRLAVHRPDIARAALVVELFDHQTARAALEVLMSHESLAAAVAAAPPELSEELTRLSVEELLVEPTDVLGRLATEVARVEMIELEREARASEDPLQYSQAISYLKVTLEELRRPHLQSETVGELLDWLKLRRSEGDLGD